MPVPVPLRRDRLLAVLVFLLRRMAPLVPFVSERPSHRRLPDRVGRPADHLVRGRPGRAAVAARAIAGVVGFLARPQPGRSTASRLALGAVVGAASRRPAARGGRRLGADPDLMTALGVGRTGGVRAGAAGRRGGRHGTDPHRTGDARRRRAPGEPDGAAGRRDRDGGRRPRPRRTARLPGAAGRPAGTGPAPRGCCGTGWTTAHRSPPSPAWTTVERLVEGAPRAAGMTVELRRSEGAPVDAVVSRAAYRIVQEALTNAGRHAPGAAVTGPSSATPAGSSSA